MNTLKTYQFAHCHWNYDNDFQVRWTSNAEKNKWTVLLIPAPWSSPCDSPEQWKDNQRVRLANKIKEEWYAVLIMIPPGKPNHLFEGKQSLFSFTEYAHCIESVLYRDVFRKSVTHIVTSSLWQIATILALHNDTHTHKQQRKIIIWAPIDSLSHIIRVQQDIYWWLSKEQLITQYALQNWLSLDPHLYNELQDNWILTQWINNLFSMWYHDISIYGNDNDLYYTGSDQVDIMKSYFFQDKWQKDPFNHSFSDEHAYESLELVLQFLNEKFALMKIVKPIEWFVKWFYNRQHTR